MKTLNPFVMGAQMYHPEKGWGTWEHRDEFYLLYGYYLLGANLGIWKVVWGRKRSAWYSTVRIFYTVMRVKYKRLY